MKVVVIHAPGRNTPSLQSTIDAKNASKFARFLPSIVTVDETDEDITFLMAYRIWKRYVQPSKTVKRPGNVGHPWYNRWGYSSFDGTAFAVWKLSKPTHEITVLLDKIPSIGNSKIDMRLLRSPTGPPNTYVATYNTFGKMNPLKRSQDYNSMSNKLRLKCFHMVDPKTKKVNYTPSAKTLQKVGLTSQEHRDSYCTFQNVTTIQFSPSLVPSFGKTSLVCPRHHKRVEKNISMYVDDQNRIGYHYSINPWTILRPGCNPTTYSSTLFRKVVDFYDPATPDYFAKILQFSCSTPLIPFGSNSLLAAGHFKIKYDHIDKFPPNSPARLFCKRLMRALKIRSFSSKYEGIIHYEFIYGTFLYTVHKKTMRLQKASNAFIVFDNKKPNSLMFPCGLAASSRNDTFYLSYHENDINMKMLTMTSKEVDRMLVHTNRTTTPEAFQFEILHA